MENNKTDKNETKDNENEEKLKFIRKTYENLNFPGALGGINRYLNELKKRFPEKNITLKEVKKALKELPMYELHVPRKEKFQRRVIKRPPGAGIKFEIDVVYLPNHKRFPYGLILVDQYSRYIYLEPIKKKTRLAVQNALDKIIEENKLFKIGQISADSGLEFKSVEKYFKKKGISFFFMKQKPKASLAENAVKRLKRVLFLAMRQGKNILWPDIYKKVLEQINSRPLKVLKNRSPKEVNSPFDDVESREFVEEKAVKKTGPIFTEGELVFIELPKTLGEKDYDIARATIVRVKEVDKRENPYMYVLETIEGKTLSRKYYGYEIRHSPSLRDMPNQIEKVFKTRRKNKKKEYLVSFEGKRYIYIIYNKNVQIPLQRYIIYNFLSPPPYLQRKTVDP